MKQDKIIFSLERVEIGKDIEGNRILVDVEIKELQKEVTTINHKIIKPQHPYSHIRGIRTLSISGGAWDNRRKDYIYCGQVYDELTTDNIKSYANGWNGRKAADLVAIWKRWHLNDLVPNCIHQDSFNPNDENFTEKASVETEKCPEGYAYGSKWLVEPLPTKVEEQIIALFKLTSK